MLTPLLQAHLDQAIERLLSLFKVTTEEHTRFRPFTIKRHLDLVEFPKSSQDRIHAYHFLDTYFYFPEKDTHEEDFTRISAFHPAVIHHESGHFIHDQINPSRRREMRSLMRRKVNEFCYADVLN